MSVDIIIPELSKKLEKLELLTTDVFTKYLDLLFQREYKQICSTQLIASNEYFIEVDISNGSYKISNNLKELYNECEKKGVRFVIIPIYLKFPQVYSGDMSSIFQITGHSNAVLIDHENQTIEWFEPHGEQYKGHFLQFDTGNIIRILIQKIFPLYYLAYDFKNVLDKCDYLAPQRGDKDTYCLGWSLLYLELKLLNPKLKSDEIFKRFDKRLNTNEKKLRYIKDYIMHVEKNVKTLKSKLHSIYIKEFPFILDDIVINKQNLEERIYYLLNIYQRELNPMLRMGIFNELMGYSKYSRFNELLFQFFNKSL